ncbi:MAG: DeoR family transcriptional regulator, partial [Mesorhizobium sp.]
MDKKNENERPPMYLSPRHSEIIQMAKDNGRV